VTVPLAHPVSGPARTRKVFAVNGEDSSGFRMMPRRKLHLPFRARVIVIDMIIPNPDPRPRIDLTSMPAMLAGRALQGALFPIEPLPFSDSFARARIEGEVTPACHYARRVFPRVSEQTRGGSP